MPVMTWEKVDTVAKVTMCNGENRHNPEFLKTLFEIMDEIEADTSIGSLVMTSNDKKFWSLGLDLEFVMGSVADNSRHDELKAFLHGINKMFERFLLFPVPTIAAISGHAFGNGSIWSCSHDFRFMRADKGFFCFPEIDVNIPFLHGMLAIVKKALPLYKFEEMSLTGKKAGALELEEHHVITKACKDEEDLLNSAMEFAATFQKSRTTFAEMKKRANKHIIEVIEKEDKQLIDNLILMA